MPAMSRVHREALARVPGSVRAAFIDTVAGFETNVDAITAKAVEYYTRHLQLDLRVASYPHSQNTTVADTARALAEIRAANFVFAGPGSPTYALKHLHGSPLWEAIVERFHQGAHLLFASAASITLGRYALPVYEIFKAGYDPYWADGLDLLGEFGLSMAIVPHFNDNSGGENYDSRFCYMGSSRFDVLQAQLPPEVVIIGIDEYTALRFEPVRRTATVFGQGGVTIIANGAQSVHTAGSVMPFDDLHSSRRAVVPTAQDESKTYGYEYAEPDADEGGFSDLADYVADLPSLNAAQRLEILARIEGARKKVAAMESPDSGALVDLVLELRTALREMKRWDLGDRTRDALVELGYEIQDTREGTTWRRS